MRKDPKTNPQKADQHLLYRLNLLETPQGNQVKAARLLGVSRTKLRSKIKRHGIA
jgi:DNA-binding protein Fis